MQEVVELVKAHMWFAAAVALTPVVLRLIRAKEWWLIGKLPEPLKFLPASAILFLVSFGESAAAGDGWEAALLNALVLTVIGAPAAVGTYHMAKKTVAKAKAEPPAPDSRRASLGSIALLALGAPLALSRCAAAPIAAAWLPAVLAALTAAGTLLEQVEHWVDRFRTVLPSAFLGKCAQLLADCRAALEQVQQLAAKGGEFQAEAEKAYQRLRTLLDDLFALLTEVGLYDAASERLTSPAPMRASDDGSVAPVETMGVTMPPERLQ